jgi:hypothetical protein
MNTAFAYFEKRFKIGALQHQLDAIFCKFAIFLQVCNFCEFFAQFFAFFQVLNLNRSASLQVFTSIYQFFASFCKFLQVFCPLQVAIFELKIDL